MKMAEKKTKVLKYLECQPDGKWISPTVVGDDVLPHSIATAGSAVASPVLKALVEDGLVERNREGRYRLKISSQSSQTAL